MKPINAMATDAMKPADAMAPDATGTGTTNPADPMATDAMKPADAMATDAMKPVDPMGATEAMAPAQKEFQETCKRPSLAKAVPVQIRDGSALRETMNRSRYGLDLRPGQNSHGNVRRRHHTICRIVKNTIMGDQTMTGKPAVKRSANFAKGR